VVRLQRCPFALGKNRFMTTNRSGNGPDTNTDDSWASETLPMAVRRELLERDLSKLGARRNDSQGARGHDSVSGQHQGQSSHPQADGEAHEHSE
jgi:hypothetical protein